jgi:hypothetical protein
MSQQDDVDRLNRDDNLSPVTLPSGGLFYVHDREVGYWNDRRERYLKDNHFTNISDFQDLDRLLIAELLVQRWGVWVSQKRDYWGDPVDENSLQKAIKEHSGEIRMVKKALGLDKETRDKVRGEDSVDAYLKGLRQRAREFGYLRNEQAAKAIELWQQLSSLVQLYENCDEGERIQQHCTEADLLGWITTKRDEFEEIDRKFRETSQKMWIRRQ